MEKPLSTYKNNFRNFIAIAYWISLAVSFVLIMIHSSLIDSKLSSILFGVLLMALAWPIKLIKFNIYHDAIVFKEIGFHHSIRKKFGVAFENIYEYKIRKLTPLLYWIILKRRNGKTIQKLLSLSHEEFLKFLDILKEKAK